MVASCRRAALAAFAALAVSASGLSAFAQSITIEILFVTDGHGALAPQGPRDAALRGTVGGLAKVASVIGMARAASPNVLVFNGGDFLVGDLISRTTLGVPELQLLKQLGFDAMAIGNHEFDYGPDTLAYVFMTAYGTDTLPLLSANLDLTAMPELATWIKPALIKEVGGVKVGIFGMTVPGNPLSQPAPVVILGADDPSVILQIAGEQAAALRAAGAGVVVMLSHLGLAYDQAVAANVPGMEGAGVVAAAGSAEASCTTSLAVISAAKALMMCRSLVTRPPSALMAFSARSSFVVFWTMTPTVASGCDR
jgi:5'-nucleotidase